MSLLNALTLTEYKRVNTERPASQRRRKLALKLTEQIKLAESSEYQPTKVVWSMGEDGIERKTEVPKRVKRWWNEQLDGTILLTIRYGSKPLELAKGKNAILISSARELPTVLRNLLEAVTKGEFDELLERQIGGTRGRVGRPKKLGISTT